MCCLPAPFSLPRSKRCPSSRGAQLLVPRIAALDANVVALRGRRVCASLYVYPLPQDVDHRTGRIRPAAAILGRLRDDSCGMLDAKFGE